MKTEHAIDWSKSAAEIQDDYELVCEQREAMRSAILHAIVTSECISAGADVCDEWALELELLRRAAGSTGAPAASQVLALQAEVARLTEAVEVQEARLEMAEATKRVSQQRFARIQELEEQCGGLLAALEKLTDVFANIGVTSGIYDDEQDALVEAYAAIAAVEQPQATARGAA